MILVDTNVLVAVANSRDMHHEQARTLLETIPDDLLVPPTVIAESATCSANEVERTLRSGSCGRSVRVSCTWRS